MASIVESCEETNDLQQTIEKQEKTISELKKETKFLLKFAKLAVGRDDETVQFRIGVNDFANIYGIRRGENIEYLDCEDIKKMINPRAHNKVYNHKEYSNLPEKSPLYTLDNIVHNGRLTHIYGYLDKKTKTFVKYEYKLNSWSDTDSDSE